MLNYILKFIYPEVCGICNKIHNENLCQSCENKIKKYEINKFTIRQNVEMINIYKYDGIIREKIIEYKFQDKSYLYKTFAKMILKNEKTCGFFKKYDIIIPVPIHKKRKAQRGYNQVELIAKQLSKNTHLKLENNVLIKQKNIISQSELNKNQRKQNIKDAFKIINVEKIQNKKVLLIDDIYTTGSTINECCKTLKKAKIEKIGILTIAKD